MFKKRTTPVQNITFIAIMTGIVSVLSLLTSFVPLAGAIMSLFLPIVGVLVALFCMKRYYPLFIITSIGLVIVTGLYNLSNALIFIIPSLITGLVFGMLMRANTSSFFAILISGIIQALLDVAINYIVVAIYEINIIQQIISVFQLTNHNAVNIIIPVGVLFVSLVQFIISFAIISPQIATFYPEKPKKNQRQLIDTISALSFGIFAFIFIFIHIPTAHILLACAIFMSVTFFYRTIQEKKPLLYVYQVLVIIFSFILFILFNQKIENDLSLLLFAIIPTLGSLPFLINRKYWPEFEKEIAPEIDLESKNLK